MLYRKKYSTLIFSSDLLATANNKARFNHVARHLQKNIVLRDELQIHSVYITNGMYKGTPENTFVVTAELNCISIQDKWNQFIYGNLMQESYILQNEYNDIFLMCEAGTQIKARYIEKNTNKSDYVIIDGVKTYFAF